MELTDEFVGRAPVREAMGKVSTAITDTQCPIAPIFALHDRVVIELRDGRKPDSGDVRFARGNAALPLADEELKVKFLDCASGAADLDATALYECLARLGELGNLRDLAASGVASFPRRRESTGP